jgi:hypothetical protein
MNSVRTVKKDDFTFSSSVGKWLFQKIKFPWLFLFWLTFFSCYFNVLIRFNVRTNFNRNNPGYGELNWFFRKQELNPSQNPQWYLQLLIVLLVSFLGVLILNIICHFLQDYCENLSENWLKKLVIYRCSQTSPLIVRNHQAKINNAIFYSASSLSFYFINIPVKFFENLVKISFEIYFLTFFLSSKIEKGLKSLALGFNLVIILIFLGYVWLTVELQKQKKMEKLRRTQTERRQIQLTLNQLTWQENNNLSENKKKQVLMVKTFQLFDNNLKKNKSYFFQKVIFDLPNLIIPGLNVIFYFLYYRHSAPNFADAAIVYFLSLSTQNIFWKFRNLLKQTRNYSKFHAYYKEFNSLIKVLN